ncbi:hypothetical protein [Desulfobacter vibrioformis]|uniref:hypothetical protein n=1 Tax=Desulfobacter vibrioformis TaxID=34031 RepID=UPI0005539371|nr:hypothetical protein [Desulfobacter vibrioformis]
MTTITLDIDESKAAMLQEKAQKYGLALDQFVKMSIEDIIAFPDSKFEAAMKKVLIKNAELYNRLA